MTYEIIQIREEGLSPRQRRFLEKLRQHDQKVVVLREQGQLVFHGPVIGHGPMPDGGEPVAAIPAGSGLTFGGKDWPVIRSRLSNRYAQLTDDDLSYVPGDAEGLCSRILARTMETRRNLDRFLSEDCGCTWETNGTVPPGQGIH